LTCDARCLSEVGPLLLLGLLVASRSEPTDILTKLGGRCAAEYKYDGIRVQAYRTGDGRLGWTCSSRTCAQGR
jgi:hypothetical protein